MLLLINRSVVIRKALHEEDLILFFSLLLVGNTSAGVYSDDLGKCIVERTSPEDKLLVVQAVYAAMSKHPEIVSFSRISRQDDAKFKKEFARIFTDLIVDSCRSEAKLAFRYEGEYAFQQAFELLGQVAMVELMQNPRVSNYFEQLGNEIDASKFEGVFD